ncbi:MAG: hypothetical protein OXC62_06965 [Aestuariivita sp.]|nr:hypothetical protein [Aestuariivita sp.]
MNIATGQGENNIRPVDKAKRKTVISRDLARTEHLSNQKRCKISYAVTNTLWGGSTATGKVK